MQEGLLTRQVTRDMVAAAGDPERDVFSPAQRLRVWDELDALHHENQNRRQPYKDWNILLFGEKGDGKTNIASFIAMGLYAQGLKVYSTASLLFGERISAKEFYVFADSIEPNSVLVVDELHTYDEGVAHSSRRQRVMASGMALARKNGIRFLGITTHERRLSPMTKEQFQFAIRPLRHDPRVYQGKRGLRPTGQTYKFPPYCYVLPQIFREPYGPLGSNTLLQLHNIERRRSYHWIGGQFNPLGIYRASMMQDTWETVDIFAGMNVDAAAMRSGANGQNPNAHHDDEAMLHAMIDDFYAAFAKSVNARYPYLDKLTPRARNIDNMHLYQAVKAYGFQHSIADMRRALREEGVHTRAMMVRFDEVLRLPRFEWAGGMPYQRENQRKKK